MTCFAGNGDFSQWRYASADWDSFDWNQIYGSDVGTAWNKLSGAWVGKNDSGKIIAVANANIPDGVYSAKVGYKITQIIDMFIN